MSEQVERSASGAVRDTEATRKALGFFKVMAIIAGLAMFVLITEMILKYALDNQALSWWSPVHGFIFLIFAITVVNLGFKVGWSFGRMVAIVLICCVPFLAFWQEHQVAQEVEPQLAG
jgi:integral membrane protein